MLSGGCHCGSIRYQMPEEVAYHALCHCADCRKASGAPVVAWALAPTDRMTITGSPRVYASSEHGRRHFCDRCGTSLFYTNEVIFPGKTDVQTATLDTPDALPLQVQIQTAERIDWMATAHDLPAFDRYPGPG
ncbi:MAG TPA: GFA family protein [Brevundimonas sp.]|nr:GFA family protein [Brevundimonas sp.]